jgi:hypothetical protein
MWSEGWQLTRWPGRWTTGGSGTGSRSVSRTIDSASRLVELMLALPEERRSLFISTTDGASGALSAGAVGRRLPFAGLATLDDAKSVIDAAPVTDWIDVVIGCSFAKAECLSRQADIVSDLRTPTVRAAEIVELIASAMPPRP